jgi:2-methylisocitrate lyase-like PEP mutase family enzyme
MSAPRRFRELLAAPGILVLPGVFNGFSARLVEQAGYRAAAISGAGEAKRPRVGRTCCADVRCRAGV